MDSHVPASHRNLIVWQKAMALAAQIYAASSRFPRHEIFGITSQIRRATVSIPSNIAEGAARGGTREFLAFLYIARGSQAEVETQLRLASSFGYLDANQSTILLADTDEVGRLLTAMIYALRKRLPCKASSLSAIR
jgi:four helix bundle protein